MVVVMVMVVVVVVSGSCYGYCGGGGVSGEIELC